jgi:pimeloyl-ACP methyl ester carboxylesterase
MTIPAHVKNRNRWAFVICILFSCFADAAGQSGSQVSEPQPPGKLVDVTGHRVHIYCTGQGSPTVIVASGGFSFDWGLVQPEVAELTRICTYDPAGTAWSDPLPAQNAYCMGRVRELRELLNEASIAPPYILVGFSIGGLVARLYAARNPDEVAGIVIVDHAFLDTHSDPARADVPTQMPGVDSPPVLIYREPIALDMEDDRNFSKLPLRDQELHRWALSINSLRPTPEMAAECFSEVDQATGKLSFPLGDKPVAVVSTSYDSARYRQLQNDLLLLSRNSKHYIAESSTHMVIIDQPETVIQAIHEVLAAVRHQAKLRK